MMQRRAWLTYSEMHNDELRQWICRIPNHIWRPFSTMVKFSYTFSFQPSLLQFTDFFIVVLWISITHIEMQTTEPY